MILNSAEYSRAILLCFVTKSWNKSIQQSKFGR